MDRLQSVFVTLVAVMSTVTVGYFILSTVLSYTKKTVKRATTSHVRNFGLDAGLANREAEIFARAAVALRNDSITDRQLAEAYATFLMNIELQRRILHDCRVAEGKFSLSPQEARWLEKIKEPDEFFREFSYDYRDSRRDKIRAFLLNLIWHVFPNRFVENSSRDLLGGLEASAKRSTEIGAVW